MNSYDFKGILRAFDAIKRDLMAVEDADIDIQAKEFIENGPSVLRARSQPRYRDFRRGCLEGE